MASSATVDVDDFGNDIKETGMESLNFDDMPDDEPDSPQKGQTTHFTQFPHSAADSDDEGGDDKDRLIKDEKSGGSSSFWTFAYYQQFFDVDTSQVGKRIVGSMVPKPGSNYLVHQIRPNPDLYGPFWIATTLVFTTAIAGNLANYFSMAGKSYHWQYDFHKVTFAATAIFSYWWLVPLLLWGVLWWRGSQARFSFLEMLCVYGYSLAIYVPISILWAIQVSWLQWTLVLVGAALSGSVLLLTFWPAIKADSQKVAIGLMVFIFVMHAALAAGFVLYFFYVPTSTTHSSDVTPLPIPVNKTVIAGGNKLQQQLPHINANIMPSVNANSKQQQYNGPASSNNMNKGTVGGAVSVGVVETKNLPSKTGSVVIEGGSTAGDNLGVQQRRNREGTISYSNNAKAAPSNAIGVAAETNVKPANGLSGSQSSVTNNGVQQNNQGSVPLQGVPSNTGHIVNGAEQKVSLVQQPRPIQPDHGPYNSQQVDVNRPAIQTGRASGYVQDSQQGQTQGNQQLMNSQRKRKRGSGTKKMRNRERTRA